jgi:hypothetical protein
MAVMPRRAALSMNLPSRHPAMRLAIVLLTLMAFGLQSYIAQTHIHLAPDSFATASGVANGKLPLPDKFPANGDPANCPICQEILHSGQFVTPTAAVLLLPAVAVSIIAIVTDIPTTHTVSHAWRSRAPPKA